MDGNQNRDEMVADLHAMKKVGVASVLFLGHQRVVILEITSALSDPGPDGVAFPDELDAHGIETGSYNMPGWEGGFDGFY